MTLEGLTAALADRPRMNSLLGNAWLCHARVVGGRTSRGDVLPSRGVQPGTGGDE